MKEGPDSMYNSDIILIDVKCFVPLLSVGERYFLREYSP